MLEDVVDKQIIVEGIASFLEHRQLSVLQFNQNKRREMYWDLKHFLKSMDSNPELRLRELDITRCSADLSMLEQFFNHPAMCEIERVSIGAFLCPDLLSESATGLAEIFETAQLPNLRSIVLEGSLGDRTALNEVLQTKRYPLLNHIRLTA